MKTTLEERLSEGLARSATKAPALILAVGEVSTHVARRRRRRSNLRGALAVITIAAGVGGLLAIRATRTGDASAPTSATNVESPLRHLPDATIRYSTPTKPGAIALELADGQHITFAITGSPFYDGYSQQSTIQYDTYATGRAQADNVDVPLIPEPALGGTETLAYWTGVPATATRVEYIPAAGKSVWQTPIAGITAFPTAAHNPNDTFIAYDNDGNELIRTTWATTHLVSSGNVDNGPMHFDYSSLSDPAVDVYGPIDVTKIADLDRAATEGYTTFANATMFGCLAANGDAAWTNCIGTTDAAVKTYLLDHQPTGS